jgi:hypothetical protein
MAVHNLVAEWSKNLSHADRSRVLRSDVFPAVEQFSTQELNRFGAQSLITHNANDVQQVQIVLVTIPAV